MTSKTAKRATGDLALPQYSPIAITRHALAAGTSFPALLTVLLLACWFVPTCLRLKEVGSEPPGRSSTAIFEGDVWWHVATGELILSTGTFPRTDPFSFTAGGNDWIAFEWLGDVFLALTNRWAGLTGLMVVFLTTSACVLLLLWYCSFARTGNSKTGFTATIAVLPLAILPLTLRPQIFGYLLFAVTLTCLERFREGYTKTLWVLPAVFLVWVNTHGSFVVGLLTLFAYWAGGSIEIRAGGLASRPWTAAQRMHLAVVALLCVSVLPLTPYGARVAGNPVGVALFQPGVMADIQEWQPLTFQQAYGKFAVILLLLFLALAIVGRPVFRPEELGLFLLAMVETFAHVRFVVFLAPIFVLVIAAAIDRWVPPYDPSKDKHVLNAAIMALLAIASIKAFPSRPELNQVIEHEFPKRAAWYLHDHPEIRGPLFNYDRWGGYLMTALGPEHRVFIDGRFDLYDYAGVLADYGRIVEAASDTPLLLRKYGVQACLIRRDSLLAEFLDRSSEWHRVYEDDLSVIFVRRNAGTIES